MLILSWIAITLVILWFLSNATNYYNIYLSVAVYKKH